MLGVRNRIKIHVKAAMGARAKDEGRFLGGRPPYEYLIADAGPHPNPAKAADRKRLHRLDLDPEAAPVVKRIFAEFTAGTASTPSPKDSRATRSRARQRTTPSGISTSPGSSGTSSPSARS